MKPTAFLAHSGIWNVDDLVVTKAKLASLLCDRIVQSGSTTPISFVELARAVQKEPVLTARTRDQISKTWTQVDDSVPKYEMWLSKFENLIGARAEASPKLKLAATESLLERNLSPRENYDDFKLQLYTLAEIVYWRRHLRNSLFIGSSISDGTLQRMAAPIVEVEGLQEALSPLPASLPLTWNDVFDLRASPYFQSFRRKISELQAQNDAKSLRVHYQLGLEEIAKEVAPSVGRAGALAVLSNLPLHPNPFHIGQSVLEVRDQWSMARHFGWVFFIREAREFATKSSAATQDLASGERSTL